MTVDNRSVREIVTELIEDMRPIVEGHWAGNTEDLEGARLALAAGQTALIAILEPFREKEFEKTVDALEEYAPELGSIGLADYVDIIALKRLQAFAPFKSRLFRAAGKAHGALGNMEMAKKRLLRARTLASRQGNKSLAARVAGDLGALYRANDRTSRARYWYRKSIAESANDRLGRAMALSDLGALEIEYDLTMAKDLLEQSLEIKSRVQASDDSMAASLSNLGIVWAEMGDSIQAHEHFSKVLDLVKSTDNSDHLARAYLNLANSSAALNQFPEASKLYEKGIDVANRARLDPLLRLLHHAYAISAMDNGTYETAASQFGLLQEVNTRLHDRKASALSAHDLALALAKSGQTDEASKAAKNSLAEFIELGDKDWQRSCLLLLGIEIEPTGSETAHEFLLQAVQLQGGCDRSLELDARTALWQSLIQRRDFAEAKSQLDSEIRMLADEPASLVRRLRTAGLILEDMGRPAEAAIRLERAYEVAIRGDMEEYYLWDLSWN